MKNRMLAIAVIAVMVVGFSACKSKTKSDDNVIQGFKVNNVDYDVNKSSGDITKSYQKASELTWTGFPTGEQTPQIVGLPKNAKTDPDPVKLNFNVPQTEGVHVVGTFAVVAENGDRKNYSVKVTREAMSN